MEWRAITVRYPWSALIVDGIKPVENRSGGFPKTYRGGLLIHEAKEQSDRGMGDLRVGLAYGLADKRWPTHHAGCYVGRTVLVDVHRAEPGCCESEWAEYVYRDARDRVTREITHLVLERPKRFRYPMRDRGQLGLWRPLPAIVDLLPL